MECKTKSNDVWVWTLNVGLSHAELHWLYHLCLSCSLHIVPHWETQGESKSFQHWANLRFQLVWSKQVIYVSVEHSSLSIGYLWKVGDTRKEKCSELRGRVVQLMKGGDWKRICGTKKRHRILYLIQNGGWCFSEWNNRTDRCHFGPVVSFQSHLAKEVQCRNRMQIWRPSSL